MNHSHLAGLTTGTFDELYVKIPANDSLIDVAETCVVVAGLAEQGEIDINNIGGLQQDVADLQTKQETLDSQIQTKQHILTATFPLKIQDDNISLGFLSTEDAQLAAQERAQHLLATNTNTATIAAHEATIAAHEDTLAEYQILLDQLVTLLPPPPGSDYVELNGTTNHIAFPSGFTDIFDWSKSWSLGVDFYGLPDEAGDGSKASLFSSGGSHLTLHRPGGATGQNVNYSSFNTCSNNLYNVSGRANANTWYSPLPDSRILYSFDHTTKQLQYVIGTKGGSWNRRANISIPDSFLTVQILGDDLNFGLGFSGTGGAGFSSVRWMGSVGDIIVSKHAWNDAAISEIF